MEFKGQMERMVYKTGHHLLSTSSTSKIKPKARLRQTGSFHVNIEQKQLQYSVMSSWLSPFLFIPCCFIHYNVMMLDAPLIFNNKQKQIIVSLFYTGEQNRSSSFEVRKGRGQESQRSGRSQVRKVRGTSWR